MENIATDPVVHQLMKQLKFTQIICVISSILTLCLLAGGIFLFYRVRGLAQNCEPVVEKVAKLDVEAINSAIEKLDVDAINSAVKGLDTEELTQSLKNLNEAVEKIREISEKMGDMASRVGGFFGRN